MYRVILLNDDYTPMEFVVDVLQMFFNMGREQATQVMLMVHTRGKGVCGVFTRDVAETRAAQVNQYARDHQHPRSEEHTSELQSRGHLVCRLLLEKKKQT